MDDRLSVAVLNVGDIDWSDSQLLEVRMNYDAVRFDVRLFDGSSITATAFGYIFAAINAFWDDTLVRDFVLLDADPAIDRAVAALGDRAEYPSGNADRNERQFRLLRLTFEDTGTFECVAVQFEIKAA